MVYARGFIWGFHEFATSKKNTVSSGEYDKVRCRATQKLHLSCGFGIYFFAFGFLLDLGLIVILPCKYSKVTASWFSIKILFTNCLVKTHCLFIIAFASYIILFRLVILYRAKIIVPILQRSLSVFMS